jgi:hypothetical protein
MFIEEMGKTGVTTLLRPNMSVAARMTAGDQVALKKDTITLNVETMSGEHVGELEPKLGQRLLKLIEGGNEYVAAIQALDETHVKVFIRETFQHADQTGKLSFPPTVTESFRAYTKGRLLRKDADEDNYWDEGTDSDDWEGEAEADERPTRRRAAAEDDEEEDTESGPAINMGDEEDDE